ncbi:MAG: sulfite exporter TauE/SafE family protein [Bacteroidota bacterium]
MDNLILFILLSILAEIVGTIGGFGSSLLFVPIAGFFLDFHSVLGITALFHLGSNISKVTLFRKGLDRKLILRIGIPSVIFVIAGAWLSQFCNNRMLEIILAVFLITLSLALIIVKKLLIKPNLANAVSGGALSGLAAGLLGTGGAIRGLTLAAFNLEKNSFIATSAVIDLGIDLSRSVVYLSNGFIHTHDLYLVPILIGVSFGGTYIGKQIVNRFSEKQFKSVVLVLILLTGLVTLSKQIYFR